MRSRFEFYKIVQHDNESEEECNFQDQVYDHMRDKFIFGLRNSNMKNILIENGAANDISFQEAYDAVKSQSAAVIDINYLSEGSNVMTEADGIKEVDGMTEADCMRPELLSLRQFFLINHYLNEGKWIQPGKMSRSCLCRSKSKTRIHQPFTQMK